MKIYWGDKMASFLKFLNKHKWAIIIITIMIIIFVAMFLLVRSLFFVDETGTLYGNRLDGIEQVKLNEDTLKKMVEGIKKSESVQMVTYRLEGKVLNVSIDVTNGTTVKTAKTFVDSILSSLTDKEKSFYDIQVFLTCSQEKESKTYPIIGYKHRTSSEFVW